MTIDPRHQHLLNGPRSNGHMPIIGDEVAEYGHTIDWARIWRLTTEAVAVALAITAVCLCLAWR